jgi:hypothetical protein
VKGAVGRVVNACGCRARSWSAGAREPIVVRMDADALDAHLFATTAEKVQVPTPSGAAWLRVDAVLAVEPA